MKSYIDPPAILHPDDRIHSIPSSTDLHNPSQSRPREIRHTFKVEFIDRVVHGMIVWVEITIIWSIRSDADYRVAERGPGVMIRAAVLICFVRF